MLRVVCYQGPVCLDSGRGDEGIKEADILARSVQFGKDTSDNIRFLYVEWDNLASIKER